MKSIPSLENAEIRGNSEIAPGIYRMQLAAPIIGGCCQAGQFVMVGLPYADPLLRRPFSIHQMSSTSVTIIYKVVGKGTQIMAGLGQGHKLSLLGPLGNGFSVQGTNHCLVGGGLGIAPLLALAEKISKSGKNASGPVHILLGGRNSGELLARDAFAELGEVEVATDDGSTGHHGLVTELLQQKGEKEMQVYCCGPQPMMRAVASICREKGWACQVSLESHMACGMGACLGCAVAKAATAEGEKQYAHVCKDGPVFNAGEIWP